MKPLKVIIIGASSGIGKELARVFSAHGYEVGLCARRVQLLEELKSELPTKSFVQQIDLREPDLAALLLDELIDKMGGIDLIVISSSVGYINPDLEWLNEKETIDVNITGFANLALKAYKYFLEMGRGHIVGISSISALRACTTDAPSYAASKAFQSNYLQGLYYKAKKSGKNISVTTIEPGFVDTAMAQGNNIFWMASAKKAAEQIYEAIVKGKKHAYITKRWCLIAWLIKLLPDFVYSKV